MYVYIYICMYAYLYIERLMITLISNPYNSLQFFMSAFDCSSMQNLTIRKTTVYKPHRNSRRMVVRSCSADAGNRMPRCMYSPLLFPPLASLTTYLVMRY